MKQQSPKINKPEDTPPSTDHTVLPHTDPKTSAGEKWYNHLVYQGLNYWANLAISLTTADYFTNRGGRKHLDKVIGVTERALLKTGLSAPHAIRTSKVAWEVLAMTCGGWIAALGTKPLEDNKRPIVHWLNERLGVDQTAPDGHKLTPDQIYIEKEQPHQSWFNIIKRRLIASVAIVGTGHVMEYTVGKDKLTNAIVGGVNTGLKSGVVPFGNRLANSPVFGRYLGFAALDTIFTGVHAGVMSLTNGAQKAHMPREMHEHAPEGIETKPNEITLLPAAPEPAAEAAPEKTFASRLPSREQEAIKPKKAESHTSVVHRSEAGVATVTP